MNPGLRVDKWLFFTRLFKTRGQAVALIEAGAVWLNGRPVAKPAQVVKIGDALIFPTGKRLRRVTVLALGLRRGPAPEAQGLYRDEQPPRPD
ncbi:RNA-binding S4 domain-containing protein [Magnetospirillum sulfuroxidans]|uniref:RNA-binding S4 domain-containing protein n=1 Tax=Magnetospirillum sulfuroxidans TaxID=611300 RepID=A0ABS5IEF9_9PROT|nr:RNA-binding S4 domain-containing protein [Magnetospirillum sulfuroxidans]MBR9972552.1 RNA-binding S4 domain-containing protein [Magnetospirillum sulfuroxidans]